MTGAARPKRTLLTVSPLPVWMPLDRLLGEQPWQISTPRSNEQMASAEVTPKVAAEIAARLRGLGFGGKKLVVTCEPALPRALVRAGRSEDARRRRKTTPGFSKRGTKLDKEGRISLTPEALATAIGEQAAGRSVLDAGCGAGGNSIGFARAGCQVTALEPNSVRLQCARHNAQRYGVARAITFVQASLPQALHEQRAAILFVDPPWGAQWDRACCNLGDLPLLQQVFSTLARPHIAKRYEQLWAKLPPSFDTRTLPQGAKVTPYFGEASGDWQRVKFLLVELPASAFCA